MSGPNKQQIDRFKETARALGCDEDEAAFDEKMKGITQQKSKDVPRPLEDNPTGPAGR